MALTKVRLGDLIEPIDERNDLGIREFYGVNINKEFMPTAANTEGLDESKYKVVRKNRFVFSGMQTGRDICIRISLYKGDSPILVSPAYTTFEIERTDIVSPIYFFMRFLSKEMDRYGAFCSDGSIRSNLDWDVFCDIEIELPDLAAQERVVAVYRAMAANRESYERGLADLKLACDAAVEHLKKKYPLQSFGAFIERVDVRNTNNRYKNVKNVSVYKKFGDVSSKVNKNDLAKYKIVMPREITFVQTTHNEKVFCNAMNDTDEPILVTSVNEVFRCDESKILPEYLCLNFNRKEFDRYARFHSWGSARETFTWADLINVKIPIPPVSEQMYIVNLFKVLQERARISDRLREQIKNLCPILIKGSLADGAK